MKLEGKSELFKALAGISTDVPREPDRCQPCPECGDGYKDCKCPLADNYVKTCDHFPGQQDCDWCRDRQIDGSEATNCDGFSPCPRCMGTGYRRDWRGYKVQCDDCWPDNGPE
jgi:hypothetical protein